MFYNRNVLSFGLVVIKYNFITSPADIVIDLLEICYGPFAYDVKCIAYSNFYFLAYWSVIYLVFPYNLKLPLLIMLINLYSPAVKRYSKAFCLRVLICDRSKVYKIIANINNRIMLNNLNFTFYNDT